MSKTVFLSSTGADLRAYREAAFLAIQKLDGWKCIRMEDFGARSSDVDSFCRATVGECDLFIGIIGHRFGDGPAGIEESYTQREYWAARAAGKPTLLYLAPDDFSIPASLKEPRRKIEAQEKFRKDLANQKEHIVSLGFSSPDHLARQIVTEIYNWERQRFRQPTRAHAHPTPYLKLFLSYARNDEEHIQELRKNLKVMERNGEIHTFYDRTLAVGESWEARILQELDDSDIVVCQLSRDFLASDFCVLVELETAIHRKQRGDAELVAYVLHECPWRRIPNLSQFQILDRPIESFRDIHQYWTAIGEVIQRVVDTLRESRFPQSANPPPRPR